MSLSFSVLGSGSGGNCTLVLFPGRGRTRPILIDAGLSPRATVKRLGPFGIGLADVADVLLTHIDNDHFHAGWARLSQKLGIRWRVHLRHLVALRSTGLPLRRALPFEDAFSLGPGTRVEPTLLPHDQLGTVGFVLESDGVRLGYATDLGRVPATLLKRLGNLTALAIESNYDRELQMTSDRPAVLKRRIMGGLGHLSNEQALEAVVAVAARGDLQHIALLHLSRHCNDPGIVRRLFAARVPHLLGRLTISNQYEPTPLLHVSPAPKPQPETVALGRQLNFLEALPGPSA